ncbi:PREDICTED: uncharacterized protein LOC105365126 [Ceratosolen solmsi marchali]|uniref:Uncharacterized protein LOC105365126 n=1 Tax=Ceratosolen solmsi marchali TaxID=326594 RepID=A0AAJ7DYX7_9HYME|nr:PREDICTED: uncharacterized protein LOC105365126 [Ceratosolen solmsi marchali]
MSRNIKQELFLLEFLVDKVNIPSVKAMEEDIMLVKTCIEFKILNLPPIDICQDATDTYCSCLGDDGQVFRKGKSCLFALPCNILKKPIKSFPVVMSVYKKLPPRVLPDVMTIGTNQIELRDIMNCLLEESSSKVENPCRTLKNNFRIKTATGQCVGEVGLYLRFTQLGRKVVTQFQNPHNKKLYLFSGANNSPIFQCRKVPSELLQSDVLEHCICEKPKCGPKTPAVRNCCTDGPTLDVKSHNCPSGETKKKKSNKSRPCCSGPSKEPSKNENIEDKNDNDEKEEIDKFETLRKQREHCQQVWEKSWEKKLKDEERMEDYKACCAPNEFFKKPKMQSNIWVKVKHEKNIQHVYMAFM